MSRLKRLIAFLGAVPGAIRGVVNAEEKIRALLVALASGNLSVVVASVAALFGVALPAELLVVIVPVIAYAVEFLRRRFQGAPDPSRAFRR